MLRQFLMFLPIFLAGILLGAWAREPIGSESASLSTAETARNFDHAADYERLEQMITSLTEIVNLEVAERRRLENQLSELAIEINKLGGTAETAKDKARVAAAEEQTKRARTNAADYLTEERFIEAGFPPDVAARLKRDMDQIALNRLFLRDQAVREGWLGSQRYRNELRDLNIKQKAFRDNLDGEEYDRYLYALGQPNRVVVSSVLTGSPAGEAGLQVGDAILNYGDSKIFSPAEIRRETSRGDVGSMVAVEIMRDGQRQVIYVPRGPLGVNMTATSAKPN